MLQIAKYHLYLGCVFAPLIIFFALSGAWQTLNLHRSTKDGRYRAPQILVQLSEVHLRQRWALPESQGVNQRGQESDALISLLPRRPLSWLSAFMGLGLATSSILGIVLAFQRTRRRRRWLVVFCLAAGCLLPITLLLS